MPMKWDHTAHAKLFEVYLKLYKPTSLNLQALAEAMGPDCTAKAISHQIVKLRAGVYSGGGGDDGSSSTAALPTPASSPASRKLNNRGTAARPRAAPAKKKVGAKSDPFVNNDEDEDAAGGNLDFDKLDDSGDEIKVESPGLDRSQLRRSVSAKHKRSYAEESDEEEKTSNETAPPPSKRARRQDTPVPVSNGAPPTNPQLPKLEEEHEEEHEEELI